MRNSSSRNCFDPKVAKGFSALVTSRATLISLAETSAQYCERQVQLGLPSLAMSLTWAPSPATLKSLAKKPLSLLDGLCFVGLDRDRCDLLY